MSDRHHEFAVRVLAKHPNKPLENLDRVMKVSADFCVRKGDVIPATSRHQSPSRYPQNIWSYSYIVRNERAFFEEATQIARRLSEHKNTILEITGSGGQFEIIFHFHGDKNIGDVLPTETIKLLGDLGVRLGLEIFPDAKALL